MTENEKICFSNMKNKLKLGNWWGNGEYGTVGQILQFIYLYCGMNLAERLLVDASAVYYPSEKEDTFAIYHFDSVFKIPVFIFCGKYMTESEKEMYEENQRIYLEGLRNEN